jgi:hypothetical protein
MVLDFLYSLEVYLNFNDISQIVCNINTDHNGCDFTVNTYPMNFSVLCKVLSIKTIY